MVTQGFQPTNRDGEPIDRYGNAVQDHSETEEDTRISGTEERTASKASTERPSGSDGK